MGNNYGNQFQQCLDLGKASMARPLDQSEFGLGESAVVTQVKSRGQTSAPKQAFQAAL